MTDDESRKGNSFALRHLLVSDAAGDEAHWIHCSFLSDEVSVMSAFASNFRSSVGNETHFNEPGARLRPSPIRPSLPVSHS